MESRTAVGEWLLQLGEGDARACELLWHEYFEKLVRHARRRLEGCRKRERDEEDVALSALHSFCQGMKRGQFDQLASREDLWKLLLTITARKATSQRRRELALKRGGGRLKGESIFIHRNAHEDPRGGIEEILGNEPTPELTESLLEQCDEMLDLLEDETLREVAIMTLEGYSQQEIADKLGCVPRTVLRKQERIRLKWTRAGYHPTSTS